MDSTVVSNMHYNTSPHQLTATFSLPAATKCEHPTLPFDRSLTQSQEEHQQHTRHHYDVHEQVKMESGQNTFESSLEELSGESRPVDSLLTQMLRHGAGAESQAAFLHQQLPVQCQRSGPTEGYDGCGETTDNYTAVPPYQSDDRPPGDESCSADGQEQIYYNNMSSGSGSGVYYSAQQVAALYGQHAQALLYNQQFRQPNMDGSTMASSNSQNNTRAYRPSTVEMMGSQRAMAFLAGPRERIHVFGNPIEFCPRCHQEGYGSVAWRPHRHIGELKIRYICDRHFDDLDSNHHFDIPLCPLCGQVLYLYEFNGMLGVSSARRLHKYVLKCASRHVLPLIDLFCQTKRGNGRCHSNFKLQWSYGTMVKRCEAQKNRDHDLWWVRYKNEWKQRRTIIRYKKDFLRHLSDVQRALLLGLGIEGEAFPDPKIALGPTYDALLAAAVGSPTGPRIKKRHPERRTRSHMSSLSSPDEYDYSSEVSPAKRQHRENDSISEAYLYVQPHGAQMGVGGSPSGVHHLLTMGDSQLMQQMMPGFSDGAHEESLQGAHMQQETPYEGSIIGAAEGVPADRNSGPATSEGGSTTPRQFHDLTHQPQHLSDSAAARMYAMLSSTNDGSSDQKRPLLLQQAEVMTGGGGM